MSATVFDTPLDARSLIEASAGTGKTYALAGLFARAVITDRLQVPQILAVTYTVAATQELHERVRLRLQRAAQLATEWRAGDPAERDTDNAETALLRRMLHVCVSVSSRHCTTSGPSGGSDRASRPDTMRIAVCRSTSCCAAPSGFT